MLACGACDRGSNPLGGTLLWRDIKLSYLYTELSPSESEGGKEGEAFIDFMTKEIKNFLKPFLKNDLPGIKPGDTIKVYQKVKETPVKGKGKTAKKKEEAKERIQVFEGVVLARKHGKGLNATITVRKMVGDVGVERIFPLHSPSIEKIEVVSHSKVRRAKLYYLRERTGKSARLKKIAVKKEKDSNAQVA